MFPTIFNTGFEGRGEIAMRSGKPILKKQKLVSNYSLFPLKMKFSVLGRNVAKKIWKKIRPLQEKETSRSNTWREVKMVKYSLKKQRKKKGRKRGQNLNIKQLLCNEKT